MSTVSRTNGDAPASRTASAPAILLWILVIGGLLYGVVETAMKVQALLGG
jgi:hypothetical protein